MRTTKQTCGVSLAAVLLACAAGCPRSGGGLGGVEEPLPMGAVIERVNRNNRQMDFLLKGVIKSAVGKWRRSADDSAPSASFDLNGVLIYRKPRDLYLRLTHTMGGKIEAGSNLREFWVWEQLQENRYYWGEHEFLDSGREADLPIRPDVLLDVLGVGDLPADTTGPCGPALWVREEAYQLVFLAYDEDGQGYISKVMDVARREPYLIERIHYFDHDGREVMQVAMSDYLPIDDSEVLAPRKIEMQSLENDNHLTLRFQSIAKSDPAGTGRFFMSPMQRGDAGLSHVRRVDGWRPQVRPASVPVRPPTSVPATCPTIPDTRPDAETK